MVTTRCPKRLELSPPDQWSYTFDPHSRLGENLFGYGAILRRLPHQWLLSLAGAEAQQACQRRIDRANLWIWCPIT